MLTVETFLDMVSVPPGVSGILFSEFSGHEKYRKLALNLLDSSSVSDFEK